MVIALIVVGAVATYAYVLHARRTPAPVLDLALLELPTMRAAVVGGFIYRSGIGAMPFLLPLLLQLGFGLTAFQSGLITLSNVVGAMGMKTVIPIILRRFGFRRVLVVNALISAALVAACATFTPGVSFAWIVGVLIVSGFFRSLEFTSLNTIAYADVDNRRMSRATSLVAVAQQVSISVGVAIGALAVDLTLVGARPVDHYRRRRLPAGLPRHRRDRRQRVFRLRADAGGCRRGTGAAQPCAGRGPDRGGGSEAELSVQRAETATNSDREIPSPRDKAPPNPPGSPTASRASRWRNRA